MLRLFGSCHDRREFRLVRNFVRKNEHRRVEQLEGILGLLRHIREQISCFRRTKSKILISFSDTRPEMRVFVSNLHASAGEAQPLSMAIERCGQKLMLTAGEKEQLTAI